MWQCEKVKSVKMCKFAIVKLRSLEIVKMWIFENAVMWKCKMWICERYKMKNFKILKNVITGISGHYALWNPGSCGVQWGPSAPLGASCPLILHQNQFVLSHVCTLPCSNPPTFVPNHICTLTCSYPTKFLLRHVRTTPCFYPVIFVPHNVRTP